MCSEKCKDIYILEHQRKPKEPAKSSNYTLLMDYIKQLDPDTDFIAVTSQVKRMATEYGMTYDGMRYALWYSINIADRPYRGVGILPYVYEDAKKYWLWQKRMKQQVTNWNIQDDETVIMRHDAKEDVFV